MSDPLAPVIDPPAPLPVIDLPPPPPVYTEVTSLAWLDAAKSRLSARVIFSAIGPDPIPFSARADDPEPHGREIFERAVAGDFGKIAAFKAPTAAQVAEAERQRAATLSVSDVQFAIACQKGGLITADEAVAWAASGTLPAGLEAAIATLPEDARFEARIKAAGSKSFSRASPFVSLLASALGMTDDQMDALFVVASAA